VVGQQYDLRDMNIKLLSWVSVILLNVSGAWAQGNLTWQFDNADFVVQPTDQILVTGTLANDSSQPYTITEGTGVGYSIAGLQSVYTFTWLLDLTGDIIPPNSTLQFDLCTLTPIDGFVQPGVYQEPPIYINFSLYSLQPSSNTFEVTVIPEASMINPLVVGLACLGILSLLKRACQRGLLPPSRFSSGGLVD